MPEQIQGTPATPITLMHHAAYAMQFDCWDEVVRLFAKAAALIVKEPAS